MEMDEVRKRYLVRKDSLEDKTIKKVRQQTSEAKQQLRKALPRR